MSLHTLSSTPHTAHGMAGQRDFAGSPDSRPTFIDDRRSKTQSVRIAPLTNFHIRFPLPDSHELVYLFGGSQLYRTGPDHMKQKTST